jgi:hypothetical protein
MHGYGIGKMEATVPKLHSLEPITDESEFHLLVIKRVPFIHRLYAALEGDPQNEE